MWNLRTVETAWPLHGHSKSIHSVALSPDGQHAASGGEDHTVNIWDLNKYKKVLTLRGHTDQVRTITFSPDGKWIVSAGDDFSVRTWDAKSGKAKNTFHGHKKALHTVVFSSDGKQIMSADGGRVLIWDSTTGKILRELRQKSHSMAVSEDQEYLAFLGGISRKDKLGRTETIGQVRIVRLSTGKVACVVEVGGDDPDDKGMGVTRNPLACFIQRYDRVFPVGAGCGAR